MQIGNYTRLRTRAFVAMCGTFGFELDLTASTTHELLLYKEYIKVYLVCVMYMYMYICVCLHRCSSLLLILFTLETYTDYGALLNPHCVRGCMCILIKLIYRVLIQIMAQILILIIIILIIIVIIIIIISAHYESVII